MLLATSEAKHCKPDGFGGDCGLVRESTWLTYCNGVVLIILW